MDEIESPSDPFGLYDTSFGSDLYCVDKWLKMLDDFGDDKGRELAEEAKVDLEAAREKDFDWKKQKQTDNMVRKGAREYDNKIDRTLGNLSGAINSLADIEADTEPTRMAREMSDDLFPEGVYHITSRTFDDQHETVQELTKRLRGDYQVHLDKLSLEPIVGQLEELNEEFGELLETDADRIEYDEVQAARAEAKDTFHRLVAHLICTYGDDRERFKKVMAPLNEQTRRTRRQLKRRGTIPPVDRESGEPVEPTGEGETPQNDGGQPDGDGQNDGGQSSGDSGDGQSTGESGESDDQSENS